MQRGFALRVLRDNKPGTILALQPQLHEARARHRVVPLERAVDAERARVLAEERADGLDAVRVHDQRSACSSARSWSLGSHAPALTFARTWSGLVAPAITDATAGIAARPPIATSSSETPRSPA